MDDNHTSMKHIFNYSVVAIKLLILSTFLLFASLSQACVKTLKVSVPYNWPPYAYKVGNEYKGLDIEILQLVLKEADLCWEYVNYPSSARAFTELSKGNVDLLFAASWSKERELLADYTVPYREESMMLFTHNDNERQFSFDEKSTIAINRGGFYGDKFSRYQANCPECIMEISLSKQRFFLLNNKRVDFVIEDELAGQHSMLNSNLHADIRLTDTEIHRNNVYYMVNKDVLGEAAKARLNQAIKDNDEEINRLIKTYRQKYAQ